MTASTRSPSSSSTAWSSPQRPTEALTTTCPGRCQWVHLVDAHDAAVRVRCTGFGTRCPLPSSARPTAASGSASVTIATDA